MKIKRLLMPTALLLVFLGLPAFLAWNFLLGPVLETNNQFRPLLGKTEAEVIAALGQPKYRVTPAMAKDHGIDYPWRERQFAPVPDRTVHKEVLLYDGSREKTTPFGVYIFIASDGRVEAIDFAGS